MIRVLVRITKLSNCELSSTMYRDVDWVRRAWDEWSLDGVRRVSTWRWRRRGRSQSTESTSHTDGSMSLSSRVPSTCCRRRRHLVSPSVSHTGNNTHRMYVNG